MAGGGGVGSADGGRRTGGRTDGRTGEGERENRNGGRSAAPARGGSGLDMNKCSVNLVDLVGHYLSAPYRRTRHQIRGKRSGGRK